MLTGPWEVGNPDKSKQRRTDETMTIKSSGIFFRESNETGKTWMEKTRTTSQR